MIFYNAKFNMSLRTYGITIPLLSERFENVYNFITENISKKDLEEIVKMPDVAPIGDDAILLTHSEEFVENLKKDPVFEIMKTYELVQSDGSYHRFDPEKAERPLEDLVVILKKQVGMTLEAARFALDKGFAFFIGGGFHHAMSFGGRGFCLLNDMVIASNVLLKEEKVKKIWIVDVDAHKGCGTAELCKNNPSILTMSIHMQNGWPLDGAEFDENGNRHPWYIPSELDIPIGKGEESFYIERLKSALFDMILSLEKPDLVFVVQGSDPYEHDELESAALLKLTLEQMCERDQLIFDFFESRKIPQCYVMSGGYGKRAHEPTCAFLEYVLKKRNVKINT